MELGQVIKLFGSALFFPLLAAVIDVAMSKAGGE